MENEILKLTGSYHILCNVFAFYFFFVFFLMITAFEHVNFHKKRIIEIRKILLEKTWGLQYFLTLIIFTYIPHCFDELQMIFFSSSTL